MDAALGHSGSAWNLTKIKKIDGTGIHVVRRRFRLKAGFGVEPDIVYFR